ncbi:hypothetical protein [Nocardiopsis trehalosi]|uniref:hypothetical protein n=1 Tax=Nocardiopsis trehalosi TaxID=109329 RepID=UPI000B0DEFA2|nr:hypothetical protein [Nocardiopsis trehalosi]
MNNEALDRLRVPAAWALLGAVGAHMLGGLINVFGTGGVGGSVAGNFYSDGSEHFFSPVIIGLILAAVALVVTAPRKSSVNLQIVIIAMVLTGLAALLAVVTLIMGFVWSGELGEMATGFSNLFVVAGQLAVVVFAGLFLLRVLNDPVRVPRSAPQFGQQGFAPQTGAQQSFAPQTGAQQSFAPQAQQGYAPTGGQPAYPQQDWSAQQAQAGYTDPAQQGQAGYTDPGQQAQQGYAADQTQQGYPADQSQQGYTQQQGWPQGQEGYAAGTGQEGYQQGYTATGGQQGYDWQQQAQQPQQDQQQYDWQQGQQGQAGYTDPGRQAQQQGWDPYAQQQGQQHGYTTTGGQPSYGRQYDPSAYGTPAGTEGEQGGDHRQDTPGGSYYSDDQRAADPNRPQTGPQYGGQYGSGYGESYGSDQGGQAGTDPSAGQQGWYGNDDRR